MRCCGPRDVVLCCAMLCCAVPWWSSETRLGRRELLKFDSFHLETQTRERRTREEGDWTARARARRPADSVVAEWGLQRTSHAGMVLDRDGCTPSRGIEPSQLPSTESRAKAPPRPTKVASGTCSTPLGYQIWVEEVQAARIGGYLGGTAKRAPRRSSRAGGQADGVAGTSL